MVKRKRDLKLEFTARLLTDDEADAIRATVAAMNPKVHLVMPHPWRYLEIRGLAETKAKQLTEA